jgi:hypothetical protein
MIRPIYADTLFLEDDEQQSVGWYFYHGQVGHIYTKTKRSANFADRLGCLSGYDSSGA